MLEGWADAWCKSFQILEGYSQREVENSLGLRLPAALKELYCFAGRRLSRMNDPLVKPEDLEVMQNFLPSWAENQYVVTWGVELDDLALDDPPVFIDLNGCASDLIGEFATPNRLIQQNETLSEFVFQMIIWDYVRCGLGCEDIRDETEVAKLLQACQPLGFPEWTIEHFQQGRGFYTAPVKFYGNEANLVLVTADKYARCVPRNRDSFLRHSTKGR